MDTVVIHLVVSPLQGHKSVYDTLVKRSARTCLSHKR